MTMTCPDCGHNLDEVPVGDPCPECGGTRRTEHFYGSAALAVNAVVSTTISVAYNPTPGWTQQWSSVQYHLRRLREQYSGESPVGNQEMGETVATLMIALWHVSDWLRNDDVTPGSLLKILKPEKQFFEYIRANVPPLDICNGYANTIKHSKRKVGWLTARNQTYNSDGPKMTIIHGRDEMQTIDALELAEQCEQAWRELLTEHQVAIPGNA
jgi:hypothetical protein